MLFENLIEVQPALSEGHKKTLWNAMEKTGLDIALSTDLLESFPDLGISPDDYVLVFMDESYIKTDLGFPSLPSRYVTSRKSGDFSLKISDDVQFNHPIHMVFIQGSSGPMVSPGRIFHRSIQLGKRSRALVVEHYVGDYYQNPVNTLIQTKTEIVLQEEAILGHVQCMEMDGYSSRSDAVIIHQQTKSQLNSHIFTLGGYRVEHRLETHLEGESSQCHLSGLYLAKGQDDVRHSTLIKHFGAQSKSTEYFKGMAVDQAHITFHGSIDIQPTAKGSQAKQANKNLLLSEKAKIDSVPQLEIHTDDVQCQHGSATGDLSEMALFYLRSRGISTPDARQLLIEAFMEEVLATLPTDSLKQSCHNRIQHYLFEGSKNEKL